jgi:uncharacterized protein YuzE
MLVTWDQVANATYVAMGSRAAPAYRTLTLDSGTLVDLDEYDVVVGVEIINPYRTLPVGKVLDLHVPVADREALERYLRALSSGSASVTTTAGATSTLVDLRLGARI